MWGHRVGGVYHVGGFHVGVHVVGDVLFVQFSMECGFAQALGALGRHGGSLLACSCLSVPGLVQCSGFLYGQGDHIGSRALASFHKRCLAKML